MKEGVIATPFGFASLAFDSAGALTRLTLVRDGASPTQDGGAPAPDSVSPPPDTSSLPETAREAVRQLNEYFAGERRKFTVPLAPQGTAFQLAVWDELTRIPYGSTITYGELARRVDARLGQTAAQQAGLDPAAEPRRQHGLPSGGSLRIRAVGRTNGQNPIWIIIPCHRVIGADGSLTGYAGGIDVKRALLELEGALTGSLFS